MSSGWTEDPELAKLLHSTSEDARRQQEREEGVKRELVAFVERNQAMISGGFAQAMNVLSASGKYGKPTFRGPTVPHSLSWQIRGEKWGESEVLLDLSLNANLIDYRGMLHFANEHIHLDDFSEQWFRETLRKQVRDLVS